MIFFDQNFPKNDDFLDFFYPTMKKVRIQAFRDSLGSRWELSFWAPAAWALRDYEMSLDQYKELKPWMKIQTMERLVKILR